jgi:hypothetical protein
MDTIADFKSEHFPVSTIKQETARLFTSNMKAQGMFEREQKLTVCVFRVRIRK